MACPFPFVISRHFSARMRSQGFNSNESLTLQDSSSSWYKYCLVPCGWCLNCRIDKRNWYEDACNYEWNKYGSACFVTLTYDDYHINDLKVYDTNIDFTSSPRFYSHGKPVYTICKKDYVNFNKRLRSYIKYHNILGVSKNYKFVYCTEYGGKYDRPHAHYIFFGIPDTIALPILLKCWTFGIVDVGPLKSGGIRYVLDYIEKSVKGPLAKKIYDDNGLQAPGFYHSLGLGKGIILDNLDFIKSNNYCYLSSNRKLRPIPSYYIRKLHARKSVFSQMSKSLDQINYIRSQKHMKNISFKQLNEVSHLMAIERNKKLTRQQRNRGSPVDDHELNMILNEDNATYNLHINELAKSALSRSKDSKIFTKFAFDNQLFDYYIYGDGVPF